MIYLKQQLNAKYSKKFAEVILLTITPSRLPKFITIVEAK